MSELPSRTAPVAIERPHSRAHQFGVIAGAVGLALVFYLFAAISVVGLILLLAAELLLFAILLRFGVSGFLTPLLREHGGVLWLFLRIFGRGKRSRHRLQLAPDDAPLLFADITCLAAQVGVPAPARVFLEMNASAWAHPRGLFRSSGRADLGLGYDLVAGLSQDELRAVIAHELAHAKLIERGINRLIRISLGHVMILARQLSGRVNAGRVRNQTPELAQFFLRCTDGLARRIARCFGSYSRHHEFAADAIAAEICGGLVMRSVLRRLDNLESRAARISWSERVGHLQASAGFGSWLAETLSDEPASTDAGMAKALDPYATHPSISDRLAALPEIGAATPEGNRPAISLFAQPDQLAVRLVEVIRNQIRENERADEKELRNVLSKFQRNASIQPLQWIAVVAFAGGIALGLAALGADTPWLLLPGAVVAALSFWLYPKFRYRLKRELPVPSFSKLRQHAKRTVTKPEFEAKRSEIKNQVSALSGKKQKQAALLDLAYGALGDCDYLTAHIAAHEVLEFNRAHAEAAAVVAVTSGRFGAVDALRSCLQFLQRKTALKTKPAMWASAWALLESGDLTSAEAFLSRLYKKTPENRSFGLLLASSQSQRGKLESSATLASSIVGERPESAEEAALLLSLLLNAGRISEARKLMGRLEGEQLKHPEVAETRVRLLLLEKKYAEAESTAEDLRANGIAIPSELSIAWNFLHARREALAQRWFESVLAKGYYPEAEYGLGRVAGIQGKRDVARGHYLAALTMEKTVPEGGASALDLFSSVMKALLVLEAETPGCSAWIGTVSGNSVAGPVASQAFLVYADSEKDAVSHLKGLLDALKPGAKSLVPQYVYWEKAAVDLQPMGAVRAGVQQFWRAA